MTCSRVHADICVELSVQIREKADNRHAAAVVDGGGDGSQGQDVRKQQEAWWQR